MKQLVFLAVLALATAGCASETFTVNVTDFDNVAVTDAVITVKAMNKVILFGSDKAKDFNRYTALADSNGVATVRFSCPNGHFSWWVTANSCYPSMPFEGSFKNEEKLSSSTVSVVLNEHDSRGSVRLYRKKTPRPMFAYTAEKKISAPYWDGRFGFDLQCFDWLPPLGQGKVADFYYVRNLGENGVTEGETDRKKIQRLFSFRNGEKECPKAGDVIGRIEFAENCGAYIAKKTGNEYFPSTYRANENAAFVGSFPIQIVAQKGNKWLHQAPVVARDEYMVIRTRVVRNEKGEIVSANYAKILGPLNFTIQVVVGESVFNPAPNDTNLEFDPERNLYQGQVGRGLTP